MSSLTGKELQIVTALSQADLSESVIGGSCVKQLISAVVDAQSQTKSANDTLQRARSEKNSQNVLSNWWNNTEDNIKDAQLALTTEISNLNRHSSQLLIFNTAVSKVLCDQQDILVTQQRRLEGQATQLRDQNVQILDQQQKLAVQQEEIRATNQGLLEAKGLTAAQARDLIGCVQRVEAAEVRIAQVNREVLAEIGRQLDQMRKSVDDSLTSAVNSLKARDKYLLRIVQNQQHKLAARSAAIDDKLTAFDSALPSKLETAIGQQMTPCLERLSAMELRLERQAAEQSRLAKRLLITSIVMGIGLVAVVTAAVML
ncbi:hypothetical protein V2I59_08910 [Pseudomonas viridiflava]|uniref:hypothetical protein n=1 Tax=Pseudomonas viridiflava TaxID=33069 RepID=UPI002E9CD6BF|nr:hypothetical protein [Pseudomonas viridiflava]